ncbi:hypothetical protein PSHT_00252 [Puccinia striiformis]|uniref:Uncharacterized protein n=2 Tax=Puccinia striiformis TaxID=27350 RepID=A0A0L0VBM9_9BASI|nr:hypothetical protein KEM48_001535 [Puccinia striiformis f. sp. tritici PST-130]KNE96601.1 hypothetical protein PSTG_10159 [Puccinia striiformis f. sp. tritici PST-78]POW23284.1 hypothetical protein PSHT_00252 [Puccinia striiformis]
MKLPQINNILLGFAKGLVALRGPPRGNVPTTLGADPAKLESADGTNVEAVEDADCEITAPTSPETSGSKKTRAKVRPPLLQLLRMRVQVNAVREPWELIKAWHGGIRRVFGDP